MLFQVLRFSFSYIINFAVQVDILLSILNMYEFVIQSNFHSQFDFLLPTKILTKVVIQTFQKDIFLSHVRIAYIPIHSFFNPTSSRKEFILRIYLRTVAYIR